MLCSALSIWKANILKCNCQCLLIVPVLRRLRLKELALVFEISWDQTSTQNKNSSWWKVSDFHVFHWEPQHKKSSGSHRRPLETENNLKHQTRALTWESPSNLETLIFYEQWLHGTRGMFSVWGWSRNEGLTRMETLLEENPLQILALVWKTLAFSFVSRPL